MLRSFNFDIATPRSGRRSQPPQLPGELFASPRDTDGEAAGVPLPPAGRPTPTLVDEVLKTRRAEAMEEVAVQRHMLHVESRVQEESHTSARATARSEL